MRKSERRYYAGLEGFPVPDPPLPSWMRLLLIGLGLAVIALIVLMVVAGTFLEGTGKY